MCCKLDSDSSEWILHFFLLLRSIYMYVNKCNNKDEIRNWIERMSKHQQYSKIKTVCCMFNRAGGRARAFYLSVSTNFAFRLDSGRYSVFSHCGIRRCNERVVKWRWNWFGETSKKAKMELRNRSVVILWSLNGYMYHVCVNISMTCSMFSAHFDIWIHWIISCGDTECWNSYTCSKFQWI